MKNNEFKTLVNHMTYELSLCDKQEVHSVADAITALFIKKYDTEELRQQLTGKQYDALYMAYDEVEKYGKAVDKQRKKDAEIAHKAAVEMANTKKGGKHMAQEETKQEAPVEVLKGEVIDTKTEKIVNTAIEKIAKKVDTIGKGYLDIVGEVAKLRQYEAWKITGHKSMYALCADKFGMSRATVGNLEKVFKYYGDPETFKLTDECAGMSLRAMLAEIASQEAAAIEDKNGTPVEDGDGTGAGEKPAKKGKVETLVSVSFELSGDDWNKEAILEAIAKQLEINPDAKEAFPDGATVTFTITK